MKKLLLFFVGIAFCLNVAAQKEHQEAIIPVVKLTQPSYCCGYATYVCKITQSDTLAPTLMEFMNTTGQQITCKYNSPGNYSLKLSGSGFPSDKILVFHGNVIWAILLGYPISDTEIVIESRDIQSFNSMNGLINETPLEIRFYP